MEFTELIYFIAAAALLTMAPGPDIMYLLTKSLADGARQGIALAAGLCSGLAFHTALVMAGVAALIQSSPDLFRMLKYVGAAYLIYLAYLAFREKDAPAAPGEADSCRDLGKLYRRGAFMNMTNPKVLLFFLAFLPQFIHTGMPLSPAAQTGILGIIFALQAFCIFSLVAVGAGQIRNHLLHAENLPLILGWVQTGVLLSIAAALLIF